MQASVPLKNIGIKKNKIKDANALTSGMVVWIHYTWIRKPIFEHAFNKLV